MPDPATPPAATRQPLRIWPGIVLVTLQFLTRFGLPQVLPESGMYAVIGGVGGGGLAVLIWWMFFSRAPWLDRIGAPLLMIAAVLAAYGIVDPSISNGMMGGLLVMYSIPVLCLALVVAAALTSRRPSSQRRAAIAAGILLASGMWTLVRTGGVLGDGSDFHWRWTATPEERLLALEGVGLPTAVQAVPTVPSVTSAAPVAVANEAATEVVPATSSTTTTLIVPAATADAPVPDIAPVEWPGFRGRDRDSIVRGVQINLDWAQSPPTAIWRRPIGPGWSSFAVRGDLLYTQEQRGEDEIVACYRVSTGEPVWKHADRVRFWESNGGAGPRATPSLKGDTIYAFGATGILNALNASTGAVIWSRNTTTDSGRDVPEWGFTSSPLIVDNAVIVHAGILMAYDLATGEPRWKGPARRGSYSSPQLIEVDGTKQILMMSGAGATGVSPSDGTDLWEFDWEGAPIVQPASLGNGDVLITTATAAGGIGTQRLSISHRAGQSAAGPTEWTADERWLTNGLKPYFNDFVVHGGYAYGFDGSILACIDLADGKRVWKGGRYGSGQLVLVKDQNVLLVVSEEGELALVSATPDAFKEFARLPGIDGKTWNHPVLVGDLLLVRNGQEMAAFRLAR